MSAPVIDHNAVVSIYQMVLNRLPFVVDNPGNTAIISNFTLEIMNELQPCFQIGLDPLTGIVDATKVGHEENYSVLQQSVIADIAAVYVLLFTFIPSTTGTSGGIVTNSQTFLKKAKAGSAEVEYDQFDSKITTARLAQLVGADELILMYKGLAKRKAYKLGCIIDVCDDCTTQLGACGIANTPFPFRVNQNGACCD